MKEAKNNQSEKNIELKRKFVIINDHEDDYLQKLQDDGWTIDVDWLNRYNNIVINNKMYLMTKD